MPNQQPIDLSIDFASNVRSVGDLILTAKVLADLGVHADTLLNEALMVDLTVPLTGWSLANLEFGPGTTIQATVDVRSAKQRQVQGG